MLTKSGGASNNGAMMLHVPRLPFSVDPLIAEARRRARRRRWLIVCVLVAAAAAAAALELRSASDPGLAAVGGKPVVHIVLEDPPGTVYFDLKTGRKTVKTLGEEMWVDRQTSLHRIVSTEGGRRVADEVWRSHYGPATQAAAVDGFYGSLVTDFRAALRSGKVELAGRGTFDGHRVDWLRVTPQRDERWYVLRELGDVGVDARTFEPVLLRGHSGKRFLYTRVLLAKAIAYEAGDFKSHGPRQRRPFPGKLAPGYAFGSTDPSASHSTVVRGPWLTAGPTVAGLELRAVRPFTIRRSKHHFRYGAPNPSAIQGLELVYGPPDSHDPASARINLYGPAWEPGTTTRATTVYEVPRAPHVPPWSLVPSGSLEVQTGLTTLGNRVTRTLSIGYLKERGLYITIRTPHGGHTALQIARSLHPGR
jgi:hypothetical protein